MENATDILKICKVEWSGIYDADSEEGKETKGAGNDLIEIGETRRCDFIIQNSDERRFPDPLGKVKCAKQCFCKGIVFLEKRLIFFGRKCVESVIYNRKKENKKSC